MTNNQSPNPDCLMCSSEVSDFVTLVSHSLYGKYSSSQNFYYTKEVNQILEEAISPAYIQFQDWNYFDNEEEFMKRMYKDGEYGKKIQMLSEYYKFHRDLPVWNQRQIEGTMAKYYNRVKDVDYKKIKSVLKKEQGISLTTHKSFSSLDDSEYTKKSRYSTMLQDLECSNESLVLKDLCDKIGKALKKVKAQNNFKGSYYSGEKKFQQFLKKQKKRQEKIKMDHQNNKERVGYRKMKYNPKLVTKNDEVGLKEVIFVSNHSIKDRKYITSKNAISGERTTANETISREEKTKREKSKQNPHTSSRQSLSRKGSTLKNLLHEDALHASIKPIKGSKIISLLKNDNFKTINEIYKPTEKTERKENQPQDFLRKSSSKELVSRLKLRSNSQQNLPTSATMRRDGSKNKLLCSLKTNRSPRKYTISLAGKGSLQLENNVVDKVLTARENSQRILRTNSTGKLNIQNEKQYRTNKIGHEKVASKRHSTIEQILEKKLNVFKRKQAVF